MRSFRLSVQGMPRQRKLDNEGRGAKLHPVTGGVAEWFKAPDLKSDVGASSPGVRIPPPPPVCRPAANWRAPRSGAGAWRRGEGYGQTGAQRRFGATPRAQASQSFLRQPSPSLRLAGHPTANHDRRKRITVGSTEAKAARHRLGRRRASASSVRLPAPAVNSLNSGGSRERPGGHSKCHGCAAR